MTIYYDPEHGPILASLKVRHSICSILVSGEYWLFMVMHVVMIVMMKYWSEGLTEFRWEAAGVMQIFMMFMLIFYNTSCYYRYQTYYSNCMTVLRHAVLFTEELCTALPFEDCEQHRLTATRYILAGVYLFYMGVTGADVQESWIALRRKGLLQPNEINLLEDYPARAYVLLSAWSMRVVVTGLTLDCFWTPYSAHIGHIHNRLNAHVLGILRSCSKVSQILAMPIPYPYFQLMNFILLFNFFVIAFALATLKSFGTVFAFSFAEMIYLGLRKVSVDLSEPFGQRRGDFPVASFMDYVFDHSVGLLEAFSHPLAYTRIHRLVNRARNFSEEELVASCLPAVSYKAAQRKFVWGEKRPMNLMAEEDVKRILTHAFVDPDEVKESVMKSHLTHDEFKALTWKCHHCGKIFRPECVVCTRCGHHRPRNEEVPEEEASDLDEVSLPKSALDWRDKEEKDWEELEHRHATDKSLSIMREKRTHCESLRDKLGAARVRLASLQAEAAGTDLQAAGCLGGSFKNTLDAALALEKAQPPEAETVGEDDAVDTLSPILARSPAAYASRWGGQLSPNAGYAAGINFDQARQHVRRNLDGSNPEGSPFSRQASDPSRQSSPKPFGVSAI